MDIPLGQPGATGAGEGSGGAPAGLALASFPSRTVAGLTDPWLRLTPCHHAATVVVVTFVISATPPSGTSEAPLYALP